MERVEQPMSRHRPTTATISSLLMALAALSFVAEPAAASVTTIVRLFASPDPSPSVGPSPSSAPSPAPIAVVIVPTSIDASGQSDVHDDLQAFIDSVPDGSVIQFPPGAVYRLGAAGLEISDRHGLVFDGSGATLLASGCQVRQSLFLVGRSLPSTGIVIRDFILEGVNPDAGTDDAYRPGCEYQMGVAVYGSSQIEVSDVTIRGVSGDCLYLGGSADRDSLRWSEGIWFHDSTCLQTGRMGVAVVAGQDVLIERVTFDEIALHVLDIEPNTAREGARDVVFQDSTVGTYGHSDIHTGYFFATSGNRDAVVTDVVVRRNTVEGGDLGSRVTGLGGAGRNRRDFVFRRNVGMLTADGRVVRFLGVDGVRISGNRQAVRRGVFLWLVDCTDVRRGGRQVV